MIKRDTGGSSLAGPLLPAETVDLFTYSAKVVCAPSLGKAGTALVPGTYKTAVNVHNPGSDAASIKKWVTLSPPQGQDAIRGEVIEETLAAKSAFDVDCIHLKNDFGLPNGSKVPGGKGFLVIESKSELDVAAVYTQRAKTSSGIGSGLEVEYVEPVVTQVPAPGAHFWSKRAGSNESDIGRRVATDHSGNLFATGYFQGTADLGGGTLFSAGSADVFLAKYDTDGNLLWGKRFGDEGYEEGYGLAVDLTGHVVISGHFSSTINFGGGNLTSNSGSVDIFVARFDPDGNHVWSKRFGANGEDVGLGVAVDGARNAVVTGYFQVSVNFGGGTLTSAGGLDIFVAKFNPTNGSHLWSKRFGDVRDDIAWDIAVDGGGSAVVAGSFEGSINFGGGNLSSAGSDDAFVAKLDFSGNHVWSKRFGDAEGDFVGGIGVDAAGNLLVTGNFRGGIDFGGGTLVSAGQRDIFLVKLDAAGNHRWSKRFGGATSDVGSGVALEPLTNLSPSDDVAITGRFLSRSIDFGGGSLTGVGFDDIFVAKFDADGNYLWSRAFGSLSTDRGEGVALDASGNTFVTGTFNESVDFGGGTLTSHNSSDIFIAKLAP